MWRDSKRTENKCNAAPLLLAARCFCGALWGVDWRGGGVGGGTPEAARSNLNVGDGVWRGRVLGREAHAQMWQIRKGWQGPPRGGSPAWPGTRTPARHPESPRSGAEAAFRGQGLGREEGGKEVLRSPHLEPTHHTTWPWRPRPPGPLCPLRLWLPGQVLGLPAPPTVESRCFLGRHWGREERSRRVCCRHCFSGSLHLLPPTPAPPRLSDHGSCSPVASPPRARPWSKLLVPPAKTEPGKAQSREYELLPCPLLPTMGSSGGIRVGRSRPPCRLRRQAPGSVSWESPSA